MAYELVLHPDFEDELDQIAASYNEKFEGGGSDFLLAIEYILEKIESYPEIFPIRSQNNSNIRGAQVVNKGKKLSKARKFPYVLIYFVDEKNSQIVAYQIWPSRSNLPIRNNPDL